MELVSAFGIFEEDAEDIFVDCDTEALDELGELFSLE